MREITFKAKTDLELFFMIEAYLMGYIENNGSRTKIKGRFLKEKFLKNNPIVTIIITSNTKALKYYPYNKEYSILDIDVRSLGDPPAILVLLRGDNDKTEWHWLKKFIGYNPF
ncbi:hypothetical protein [Elizabethkingia meningoseptica]|uniref:hypothetical protein n=1 Tax=Elizabethkingia meningoseptica TaxID=238 RepID=UPI00301AA747|nr:hypothetical protein [Elizabethkingia anophelis]